MSAPDRPAPAPPGRAELALPELLDAVRLVPRWRLNAYVLKLTDSRELHL